MHPVGLGGTPLARGVCALITVFWAARLLVQFFVFDISDVPAFKTSLLLRIGYHMLTLLFIFFIAVYLKAAI